jgi:hypothetical protein
VGEGDGAGDVGDGVGSGLDDAGAGDVLVLADGLGDEAAKAAGEAIAMVEPAMTKPRTVSRNLAAGIVASMGPSRYRT